MEKQTIRIVWIGADQYSPDYGLLTKGRTLDVPPDVAAPWIRDGWAEGADRPRVKKMKAPDEE